MPAGFVGRAGTELTVDGRAYRFTGFDAYEAATQWGVNSGCGRMLQDADLVSLFAPMRPGSVVRFWAFQALATNRTTRQLDWRGIDRVINTAAAHGMRVLATLADQGGTCDDERWKDLAWYQGGYRRAYNNSDGTTPLSFWDYMHAFLARYRDNPAIAMVELVNEPQPEDDGYRNCSEADAAAALRSFFDTAGVEAQRVDPNHLVDSGMQGIGQCGAQGDDYGYVQASAGIDVFSVHDYTREPLTSDGGTDLMGSLFQADAANKPLIVGEAGQEANARIAGCPTLGDRVTSMTDKLRAQFPAGVRGFLVWGWWPGNTGATTCSYNVHPSDPLVAALARFAV